MITVRTCKSSEVINYRDKKYDEFLDYFLNTNIPVKDIFRKIGLNKTNATAKHIREKLRKDGYSSDERWQKIKFGKWVQL